MTSPYRGGEAPTLREPAVPLRWIAREPPLEACGLAAFGVAARALGVRLASMSDVALASLRAVVGREVIVVIAEPAALPWVDGAQWLGRDPAAPSLWLPTAERPHVAAGLFERALLLGDHGAAPLAVVRREGALTVLSLADARPVARARLVAWREALAS